MCYCSQYDSPSRTGLLGFNSWERLDICFTPPHPHLFRDRPVDSIRILLTKKKKKKNCVTIGDTGENSFYTRILTPDGGNLHMPSRCDYNTHSGRNVKLNKLSSYTPSSTEVYNTPASTFTFPSNFGSHGQMCFPDVIF